MLQHGLRVHEVVGLEIRTQNSRKRPLVMSYSLNSLTGLYGGLYMGIIGLIKRDTRSLECGSHLQLGVLLAQLVVMVNFG